MTEGKARLPRPKNPYYMVYGGLREYKEFESIVKATQQAFIREEWVQIPNIQTIENQLDEAEKHWVHTVGYRHYEYLAKRIHEGLQKSLQE